MMRGEMAKLDAARERERVAASRMIYWRKFERLAVTGLVISGVSVFLFLSVAVTVGGPMAVLLIVFAIVSPMCAVLVYAISAQQATYWETEYQYAEVRTRLTRRLVTSGF